MKAPKRTNVCFNPPPQPLLYTGDFRFSERVPSLPRPDISNLTVTPPDFSHFPSLISREEGKIPASYFTYMDERDEWKSNNVVNPISPSIYTTSHRDFTLTNEFGILCSKKSRLEHW
ncbi:hypothetical protein AVEN_208054-1 [Araneus ventricosus]|uniref:Uncharacterized protein n=1 Tax=Araneus ventricosus TaxID=182803 RepID=A0A4Y2V1Y2_ARAVE|nr:hypothetical protein AVEN_218042-1 [Araneus ventricosus]GBO18628.1 hypothetical protein AVEN_68619-1 [Araneus ventricosus]GBO18629.1 hypothetical protein AVEN_89933-1 [Araneus ventricosus]GBO18631.1 hypothetical protein AVEN_208054-1 [Araneus ventricosus]